MATWHAAHAFTTITAAFDHTGDSTISQCHIVRMEMQSASTHRQLLDSLHVAFCLHCCTVEGLQDSIIHGSSILDVFRPQNRG